MLSSTFSAWFLCAAVLVGAAGAAEPLGVPAAAPLAMSQPSADAVRAQITRLHKDHAEKFARRTARGKDALAHDLLADAGVSGHPPVEQAALLREAIRLAGEADDGPTLLAAIDRLAASFTGVVVADERRKALGHLKRQPYAVALITLLDTPGDEHAATTAGRWLGAVAGRWAEALPLILMGSGDPLLQAAAKLEAAQHAPTLELAQAWIDAARKTATGPEQIGLLKHAERGLEQLLPGLVGDDAQRARTLLDGILPQIPLDPALVDWDKLTALQWDRLPGVTLSLVARPDRTDSGVLLEPGESVRIVAHPTDTWSFVVDSKEHVVTGWRGKPTSVGIMTGDGNGGSRYGYVRLGVQGIPYGAVLMWIDTNKRQLADEITGPGHVWLGPSSEHTAESNCTGAIRVKIIHPPGD